MSKVVNSRSYNSLYLTTLWKYGTFNPLTEMDITNNTATWPATIIGTVQNLDNPTICKNNVNLKPSAKQLCQSIHKNLSECTKKF